MPTITLNVPDEVAETLKAFDEKTLADFLRHALADYQAAQSNEPQFKRLPTAPLPESQFEISLAEWKQRLLTISAWSDDDIQAINDAREYINQWQPPTFS